MPGDIFGAGNPCAISSLGPGGTAIGGKGVREAIGLRPKFLVARVDVDGLPGTCGKRCNVNQRFAVPGTFVDLAIIFRLPAAT